MHACLAFSFNACICIESMDGHIQQAPQALCSVPMLALVPCV